MVVASNASEEARSGTVGVRPAVLPFGLLRGRLRVERRCRDLRRGRPFGLEAAPGHLTPTLPLAQEVHRPLHAEQRRERAVAQPVDRGKHDQARRVAVALG